MRRTATALALTALVLTTVGCTVPVGGPSAGSSAAAAPTTASARPSATGPVVTVPGLGAVTTSASTASGSATSQESAASSSVPVVPTPESSAAPQEPTTAPPAAPPAPVVTGRTAEVDLSATCPECSVLSSRAEVVGDLSVAVVSMPGGRTAAMAIRTDGSSASILAIPYGITFPTPAGGILPCDTAGRCLVAATTPDGGVVTALGLGSDGTLTDLSPPDGFVSVGVPAQIVDLDGEPGVAVLEVPGSAPVWTVYSWVGDTYGPIGCSTGTTPDVAQLSMSLCG